MLSSFLFAVMLAASPSRAAAAKAYYISPLPAFVEVSTAGAQSNAFCSSPELRKRLDERFFHYTSAHESLHPDLILHCTANDTKARLTVDAEGVRVSALETKLDPHDFEATAFVAVHKLTSDKKTISAALAAYDRSLRFAYLKSGTDAFGAEDWNGAADKFHRLLETGMPTTILYFGLFATQAELKHAQLAMWYLLAYCESEGKDASKLTESQLVYLRHLRAGALIAPKPFDAANLDRERTDKKWSWVLNDLKAKLAAEPWDLNAYDELADAYERLGWKPLADNWRKRGALARKIAADDGLRKGIAALDANR